MSFNGWAYVGGCREYIEESFETIIDCAFEDGEVGEVSYMGA